MKIIRNTLEALQFEQLKIGDVFIAYDDNQVYMKTDEAYEYPDDRDHYVNAVLLADGSLVKINEWERVIKPQAVTLTVEERKE